jgi:ribosomal protein S18 acetylase RimI-like enzyme
MMPPPALSRASVIQGLFARLPVQGQAIQARWVGNSATTIQRRPGTEAFQVDLRPKSGGWPLPRDVQAKMEAALGANFSDVRIHVGQEASAIGAIAFTWGSDIHFAPGQYNPHTPHGQSLLGHELTHVVQQRAGRVANPFGSGVAVVQDHALEAEADRLGHAAAMSKMPAESASVQAKSVPGKCGVAAINMKPKPAPSYAVLPARASRSGWEISVGSPGQPQPVGSLQLTRSDNGVFISNLKVAPEHRRQGLAGQLIDAAVHTARTNGYTVAQLEARPDSSADLATGALVSMYQRYGFRMKGVSERGNPLMERRT